MREPQRNDEEQRKRHDRRVTSRLLAVRGSRLLWGESDAAGQLGDGRRWYWHHVNPRGCALMLTTALCWSINHTHTHIQPHTGEVNNCPVHNAHTVFTSFFPPPSSSLASSLSSSLLLHHLSSKSWPHSFFVCSPPLIPLFVTSPTSFSLPFVSLFLPSAVVLFFSLSLSLLLSDVTWSQWIECHFSAVIKVQLTAVHSGVWWQDEREGERESSTPSLPPSPFFSFFPSHSKSFHSILFSLLVSLCFLYFPSTYMNCLDFPFYSRLQ